MESRGGKGGQEDGKGRKGEGGKIERMKRREEVKKRGGRGV